MKFQLVTKESSKFQRESLARLLLECIRHNAVNPYADLEQARRHLEDVLANYPNSRYFALFDDGDEAVALLHMTIMAGLGGPWLWLQDFYVREDRRAQGWGTLIGDEVERWALSNGLTHMAAQTSDKNSPVLALTKRFKLVPRRVTWLERESPRSGR